ncbi:hypothetical protein VHAB30_46270 [Variovorax boronicumulans]|nr:hypothetical protein VHAB30_46270 [Variovorax boronicumulans]
MLHNLYLSIGEKAEKKKSAYEVEYPTTAETRRTKRELSELPLSQIDVACSERHTFIRLALT